MSLIHCQASPHGFHYYRLAGFAFRCKWCGSTRAELIKADADRRDRAAAAAFAEIREMLARKVALSDLIEGGAR